MYRINLEKPFNTNFFILKSKKIFLTGVITRIDTETFTELSMLKYLQLNVVNLREIFHKSTQWLTNLNSNFLLKENQTKLEESDYENIFIFSLSQEFHETLYNKNVRYSLPNEDFCHFINFPFEHLVIPTINIGAINCTCLLYYITRFTNKMSAIDNGFKNWTFSYFISSICTLDDDYESECDFLGKSNKCLFSKEYIEIMSDSYETLTSNDLTYKYKFIKYISMIFLLPIVCMLGILLNLLTILILSNKRNKRECLFKEKMFEYMNLNALFSLILCILELFQLMAICISYDSVFCSSIRTTLFAQYFRIIMINFLGNSIKFCCNITSLMFSLNRFALVNGGNRFKILKKVFNTSNSSFIFYALTIGIILSIVKAYQYKENKEFSDSMVYYYYDEFPSLRVPTDFTKTTKMLYIFFQVLNYFLNDIFCSFMVFVIDIFLIRSLRKNIEIKKKRFNEKVSVKILEAETAKYKTIKMVIFNTIFSFIFKSPEFFFTLYFSFFLIFYQDGSTSSYFICTVNELCRLMINLFDILYLFSFSLSFAFYYMFNTKFNLGFKNLFVYSDFKKKRLI